MNVWPKAVSLVAAVPLVTMMGCSGQGEALPTMALGAVEFQRGAGSGEPNLYATSDGRVLLSWLEPTETGDALLVAQRKQGSWTDPVQVYASDALFVNWADFPSMTELSDGTWFAHWLERVADATYAYHARARTSRDRGSTWSDAWTIHDDLSPTEHGFVAVVPSSDGGAHLLWLDGQTMAGADSHGGVMQIRARRVGADGVGRKEALVDDRVCDCCQTALARTTQGLIAAYRDRSEEEIRDVVVSRFVGGAWTEPAQVGNEQWKIPGCPVNGPALSAVGDTVALAWFTAAGGDERVFLAMSFDAGSSFGAPVRIDDGSPLGRVDVEVTPYGPLVIWMERVGEPAEVRGKMVGWDGDVGPPSYLATVSQTRRSGFPRIAVAEDHVVLAWTEVGETGGIRTATAKIN